MYLIKNEHSEFYTGHDYVFQGEKYASFERPRWGYGTIKTYKSLKVANRVKARLERTCNGFNHLEVIDAREDQSRIWLVSQKRNKGG